MDNYALTDSLLNLPERFAANSVDLRKLLSDAFNSDFDSLYDFYCEIRRIFHLARDLHLYFIPPCTESFYYLFPYRFYLYDNSSGTDTQDRKTDVYFRVSSLKSLTSWFHNRSDVNLLNKRINHLKFPELEDIPNEPPVRTIIRLADLLVPYLDTPAARLNYALTNVLPVRRFSTLPEPDEPVTVTYEESDGSLATVNISYYLYVSQDVDVPSICNLHPRYINKSTNMTETHFYYHSPDPFEYLLFEADTSVADLIYRSHHEDLFGMGNIEDPQDDLDNLPVTKYGYFPATNEWRQVVPDSSDVQSAQSQRTIQYSKFEADTSVMDLIYRSRHEDLFGMGYVHGMSDIDPVDDLARFPVTKYGFFPATNEWRQVVPDSPSDTHRTPVKHVSFKSLRICPQASDSSEEAYLISKLSHIESYYVAANNTVILYIQSFRLGPNETMKHFKDLLIYTIGYAYSRSVKDFVVSLHGNDGGNIECVYELIELFWPKRESLSFSSSIVVEELNQLYLSQYKNSTLLYPHIDAPSERDVTDSTKYRNITVTGNSITNHTTLTRLWTNKCVLKRVPQSYENIEVHGYYPYRSRPFAPNHLMFVSDFRSLSAASILLKYVQLNHLAKVVCCGYVDNSTNSSVYDASPGATGPKIDTDYFYDGMHQPFFPRNSTFASYSAGVLYYEDPTKGEIPLHLLPLPPDAVIPEWFPVPLDPSSYIRLSTTIQPYFDQCFDWEIRSTVNFCNKCYLNARHEESTMFGHPCDPVTHHFDQSKCVFYSCRIGYRRIPGTDMCEPAEDPSNTTTVTSTDVETEL